MLGYVAQPVVANRTGIAAQLAGNANRRRHQQRLRREDVGIIAVAQPHDLFQKVDVGSGAAGTRVHERQRDESQTG